MASEGSEPRAGRTVRRIILFLLLAPCFSHDLAAAAEPEAKPKTPREERESRKPQRVRLVVDHFQSDADSKRVRSQVTRVLDQEPSVDLVSVELLDAHRAHDTAFDGSAEGYAEVAKRLGVVAVIRGRVLKNEGVRVLSLVVLDGRDGRRLGRIEFKADTLKELRERVAQELWKSLAPIVAFAGKEPEEEPEPAETEPAEETAPREPAPEVEAKPHRRKRRSEPEPEPEPSAPPRAPPRPEHACSWLEIGAGGGMLTRSYAYENERSGATRSYQLKRAADTALELGVYPLAFSRCTLGTGIGINLGFEQMVPVTSHVADQELDTWSSDARAELVYRFLIGPLSIEPGVGYARRRFNVEGKYVPDVVYQTLRPRLELGLRLGPFLAEASGAARFVLDSGQLGSDEWFPESSGFGYDAAVALGAAPTPWLDVLLGARIERYRFELNPPELSPVPGPPARPNGTADAADDHFLGFMLWVRFRLSRPAAAAR